MLPKAKLKLPDLARRALPDRLGSLVAGEEQEEKEEEEEVVGACGSALESGEELATFRPDGVGFGSEWGSSGGVDEKSELIKAPQKLEKDAPVSASVSEIVAADEKRSDLEFQLSQPEINLEKLQRIASSGLPDEGSIRATTWKLLLGYLPADRELWEKELSENRSKYAKLKEELLLSPLEIRRRKEAPNSNEKQAEKDADGLLMRHEVSHEDHPLSLGKTSEWHRYFEDTDISEQIDRDLQRTHPEIKFFSGEFPSSRKNREAMRSILLLFAKLNPAIRYVQGMNEVLAPLYFVFCTDTDESAAANAEADSFFCFVRLLSDTVDHFCEQLDNSAVGIHSTLSRLVGLLKANDEQLWRHLEFKTKVKPHFYAFRWITLLLTQEFDFHCIMRIWDSLLGNPYGVQEMLLRVCCAMLLCIKSRLLSGDFVANMKLLQHYPEVNIEHLLQVAADLGPDGASSFRLSM